MLQKDVVVHAENIRAGGGLLLLEHVARSYGARIKKIVLNESVDIKGFEGSAESVSSRILPRLIARIDLSHEHAFHLHFGNLPPIYSASGDVAIYMHNALHFCPLRFVIRERPKLMVRLMLERWYMQIFMRSHYKLVVQTDEMRRKVIRRFPKNHVLVDKFFPRVEWPNPTENRATEVRRIVYVGGAEKYKNFQNTLDAVKEFSALTIQASQLVVIGNVDYESITDSCVEVIHHDKCSHDLTLHEIASSDLLIFASECESFGMPLWEAYSLGIPILAADRSYVFESCVPSHVFDPNNVSSIVNALCLHYGISRVMEPHSRTLTMGVLESG